MLVIDLKKNIFFLFLLRNSSILLCVDIFFRSQIHMKPFDAAFIKRAIAACFLSDFDQNIIRAKRSKSLTEPYTE